MDEREFRRVLDLFPVVRSRDYCAESGTSSRAAMHQAQVPETMELNIEKRSDSEDPFWQKLRMAAEKKVGPTKAALFCKAFREAHETLVHKELTLDAAQRFADAAGN